MADTIIRLKVESTEYENRLKRAVQGMQQLEKHVRDMGASFEVAEKADLEFVRALGDMETQTQSVKGQMREFTEAIITLKQQYDRLTDEEKFGEWGQAMMGSIDKLKVRAANLKDEMGDLDDEIKNMASDTLVFDQIAGAMGTMVSVFQVGQGVIQMFGIENENAVKAMAKLQGAMAVTQGLAQIQNALQKQSTTMMAIATLQKNAMAAAEALDTKAKGANIVVTKAATVAQGALNLVAKANPYVLLASAIAAVGVALIAFAKNSNKAKKAEEDHQKALDKAKEKIKNYSNAVGSSIGGILASYQMLRAEWTTLSTDQEKMDWIKNQKGEFDKLGISIGNITDAENVFVRNTENMIKALQLRAQAAALEKLATEEYEDYYRGMQEQGGIVSAGQQAELGEAHQLNLYDQAIRENWPIKPKIPDSYGLMHKNSDGIWAYTEWGAEQENLRREEAAGVSITSGDSYIAQFLVAQQESKRLFEEMGVVIAGKVEPEVENVANAAGDIAKNVEEAVYNAENIKFNKKGLSEVSKHLNDLFQNAEIGTEDYLLRAENIADLEEFQRLLKLATEYGINTAYFAAFKKSFDSLKMELDIDDETWTTLEKEITEKLKEMGIKLPVELDVKTDGEGGKIAENASKAKEGWQAAANAIGDIGGALQQVEDPSAKVAGIVMEAIACIALGFSKSTIAAAGGGPIAWIAATVSGLATMIGTIAAIKNAIKFADGGMVGGNSYSGDNIVARLNSGEGVLTAAGVRNAQAMASNTNPMGGMQLEALVSGESLRLVLANNASRRGGNRGQYAITKFG